MRLFAPIRFFRVTPRRAVVTLTVALAAALAGCNILGAVASKLPRPPIKPDYTGLAGHSIGVMVYADRGLTIDFPSLQLDLANGVQQKLKLAQTQAKVEELKESTFPVTPAQVVRYQRDHPLLQTAPVTDIAPKLGPDRLIYIEIGNFGTRSAEALTLFRGQASATLRIVEVAPDGTAKVPYEARDISTVFPAHAPAEGVLNANDQRIYVGTVDYLSTEIVKKLITHEDDS